MDKSQQPTAPHEGPIEEAAPAAGAPADLEPDQDDMAHVAGGATRDAASGLPTGKRMH